MRARSSLLLLFAWFGAPSRAQPPLVELTNLINLRNFTINDDGNELIYAAAINQYAQRDGVTNLYSTTLGGNPITTRLTNYQGEDPLAGVTAVATSSQTGRIVFSVPTDPGTQVEEIRMLAGGVEQTIATDRDGCVRILCVNCYSTCIRNVHISSDGSTVLYAAARDQPFYTVTVNGNVRKRLEVYSGSLAPSGQRVISQTGRIVFTSAAPFGPTFAPTATDVYVMNLSGSGIQQVTRLPSVSSVASEATISNNAEWIAFTRRDGPNAAGQVWAVKPDGSRLHPISQGTQEASSPSLSADGSVVSFIQGGQVKQTATAIDILALQRIVDVTKFSVSAAQHAILSGDGKRVAFLLGPPGGLPASIYTAPVTGDTAFEQLTPVYRPRMLFTAGLVSAGGTAPPSVGSLMTAFGANLSPKEFSVASQFPLPTTLGDIELLDNDLRMPLQAVTPWQINAHLSGSRLPGTGAFVVRGGNGELTANARTVVRATAPEAIPLPQLPGPLLAAAVFAGTKTLADAAHPAAANDVLEIYSLGLGITDPVVEAGTPSPGSPPARARATPRIQIGGREAEVIFAGLVPGLAGVYQVNVRVPSGIAPGYQPLRWMAADGSLSGTSGIYLR